MTDNRRSGGLTDEELELLADKIASRMTPVEGCKLTSEQQAAVIDLISTKKSAVKVMLFVFAALAALVAKDIYLWFVHNLSWGK